MLDGGTEALADYEVLEYLLFAARPRGDTKPTAKALLARFGSLAARRMARSKVRQQPVLGSWQALLDYLAIDMAHLTVERVRVLYLDARNRLILDH